MPCSASGGAIILRKNHSRNHLLDLAFHVDPEMADDVLVPGGGGEHPFTEDNLTSDLMYYQTARPEEVAAYLEQTWPGRLARIARRVMPGRRPDYLALRHTPPHVRASVLNDLGLSPEQSADLSEYGHQGTNDILLSLDLGIEARKVEKGSKVVMVAAGIGFTYAATAFAWG